MITRVAIIGAGAAGLSAARELLTRKTNFTFTVFEGTSQVGGTWYFTEEVGNDKFGNPLHTSMYKNLRTNLPKQAMAFPGFPFKDSLPCFLTHAMVQEYLEDFSAKYELDKYIRFNTRVEKVRLRNINRKDLWDVTSFDYSNNLQTTEEFDAVMVCNGHYFVPNEPEIENISNFTGDVMHSHNYRKPEDYSGQNVVLLGAKSSGTDIAVDLSKTASNVFMSHRGKRLESPLPGNVTEKPNVLRFEENSVIFEDGSKEKCDTFIFCTGYKYKFPFLDDTGIIKTDQRISPVHKHVVHIDHPSLSFIGLCYLICPFPNFHYQAAFAAGVLDGSVKLPPKQEMLRMEGEDLKDKLDRGMSEKHAHLLGPTQWDYNDSLADACGIERLPSLVAKAYEVARETKRVDLMGYKNNELRLNQDETSYVVS